MIFSEGVPKVCLKKKKKKKKNMNFIRLHIKIYNSSYSTEIVNE